MDRETDHTIQSNKYKFFTVGAIGTFMSTLDGSILNVALPTIADELQCSIDVVAWVVLAYSLTLVSLMMVFGAWTEHRGYGFAYKFGYTFFLLGSLICIFSESIHILVAGRVIQAIGSAMFQAVGPGMVSTVFPKEERGKGIGLMVMMVSAGMLAGPPLGGVLLQHFHWQSIFVINIPIGLIGLLLAFHHFKLFPTMHSKRSMRLTGAIAVSLTLLAGTLALSLIDDYGMGDYRIWGLGFVSLLAAAFFFKFESNPETALIGLDIFKNRQFSTALAAAVLMFISLAGAIILIPFYLQRAKGFGPQQVGMYLMILPILMFLIAPVAGRISDKIGSRILTSLGLTILATGFFLLSRVSVDSTNNYIILCLVLVGGGVSTFNTPNSSSMLGSVRDDQRAITSGILSTSRNIGMSIGIALATSLFAYFEASLQSSILDPPTLFVAAYKPVVLVAMGITLLGLPFCFLRKR